MAGRSGLFAAVAVVLAAILPAGAARADEGEPLAIRTWQDSLVTIETMWNLRIALAPEPDKVSFEAGPLADVHLALVAERSERPIEQADGTTIVRLLTKDGRARTLDLVLDRPANAPAPTVKPAAEGGAVSSNAMRVRTVALETGEPGAIVIDVDGVRTVLPLAMRPGDAALRTALDDADVILLPVASGLGVSPAEVELLEDVRPRLVVPLGSFGERQQVLRDLPNRFADVTAVGNTVAVSAGRGPSEEQPAAVQLNDEPWTPAPELGEWLERKEAAASASARVFRALSVRQMNHRPSNGTHTARWNVEHMAGRELGFFSAMYSNLDPSIPHMDLNPRQMPHEYQPAHPQWSGAEEARRIERVQAFTRRFAYLLDGRPLDQQLAGSPWTLERLLAQMERHWGEHTENVAKKSELPDWPAE